MTIHIPTWLVWLCIVVIGLDVAWVVGKAVFATSGVLGWAMRLWMESNRAKREGRPVPEYRMPRPDSVTRRPKTKVEEGEDCR